MYIASHALTQTIVSVGIRTNSKPSCNLTLSKKYSVEKHNVGFVYQLKD